MRLNFPQIRHKTHDMVAWRLPVRLNSLKSTPGILIKSPYSVKIEATNPMEIIEQENPNVQVVKGHVYLRNDDEKELGPELKRAFQEDIQYNVRSDLASSTGYLEVNLCTKLV